VAERAIQELENEILRSNLSNSILTPLSFSLITARLNARIRKRGLSSREMWTQRDQFSNNQLPIEDQECILVQQKSRQENHPHSVRTKCPSGRIPLTPVLHIGDIVYLRRDLNKSTQVPDSECRQSMVQRSEVYRLSVETEFLSCKMHRLFQGH
jgi:hypothetical protein